MTNILYESFFIFIDGLWKMTAVIMLVIVLYACIVVIIRQALKDYRWLRRQLRKRRKTK